MNISNIVDQFLNLKFRWNKLNELRGLAGVSKERFQDEKQITDLFSAYRKDGLTVALDLGSGPFPRNSFNADKYFGVDFRENKKNNVVYADLSKGALPFEGAYFDYVTAYDVLEHIPRVGAVKDITVYPFILLFNEIFRVLKPGGIFYNIQPCFPSKEAFQDPTHVNIMTEDTINLYFCEAAWARMYGYTGSFSLQKEGWIGGKYFSLLKKVGDKLIFNTDFLQK